MVDILHHDTPIHRPRLPLTLPASPGLPRRPPRSLLPKLIIAHIGTAMLLLLLLPLSHLLIPLSLLTGALLHLLHACLEPLYNLLLRRCGPLHPLVPEHLGHGGAVRWTLLEHGGKQFFELLRKSLVAPRLILAVRAPENVCPVPRNALVVRVVGQGACEGRMLRHHNEEDHGGGEEIGL